MLASPRLIGATICALVLVSKVADGDPATLTVRVFDPGPISFDATALGRATHPLRFVLANPSTHVIEVKPLAFRFRPVRDGVSYACEEAASSDDRWPATLEAKGTYVLSRGVTCETPLPGRYDIEVLARPRGAPDTAERTYGSFAITVEPGANPPVRLPWQPSLHAAAAGTKDLRPSKDPNSARIVMLLVNGTSTTAALGTLRATMSVTRRGSTVPPCAPRNVDLAFSGSLAPGQTQSLTTPLGCDLSAEAVYDVDIALASAASTKVHIATHAIRVGIIPPPPPRPEDSQPGKSIGGM